MIKKFIKKPVEILAIQWTGDNKADIDNFTNENFEIDFDELLIPTKEGVMRAIVGDWVIKEPFPTGDRDFYPCKNEIFKKTYKEL